MNDEETKKKLEKRKKKSRKKAFTLIELLAVIIILGVLLIIAIPSTTKYIQDSRKSAYITTAKNFIDGIRIKANNGVPAMYSTDTTYYISKDCIEIEKGGDSPYGKFIDAYVVVTYTGSGYDYYWTSTDETKTGIYLTHESLLTEDLVIPGVESIDTTIGVGERSKIQILSSDSCDAFGDSFDASTLIPDKGKYGGEVIPPNVVYEKMDDTVDTSELVIDYKVHSNATNGRGVYLYEPSKNSKYPIYYYRGNVTNNNLIFGGFCWYIVRTTETGGIKLLFNGNVSNGKCTKSGVSILSTKFNPAYNNVKYSRYMYDGVSSIAKTKLDEWFASNLLSYVDKLDDAVWCNDTSGTPGTTFAFNSIIRIENGKPSLECANKEDRYTVNNPEGNQLLTYPVGLLTADEFVLAGGAHTHSSSDCYKTFNDPYYYGTGTWTLSPYYNAMNMARMIAVYASGTVDSGWGGYNVVSSYTYPLRPSVVLKANTKFASGDGTSNNPYVVE